MKMRFSAASMLCMSLACVTMMTRFCAAINFNADETSLLNAALENLENSPYYENAEEDLGEFGSQGLDDLHSRLNLQQLYQLYRQYQNNYGNGGWTELEKRAPSAGFFGVRGKKSPSQGFYGVRGKKAPSGFYGVRGKKNLVPMPLALALSPQFIHQEHQFYDTAIPATHTYMTPQQAPAQGQIPIEENKNKESADATTTNNGQEPHKRAPSDGFMGLRGKRSSKDVYAQGGSPK